MDERHPLYKWGRLECSRADPSRSGATRDRGADGRTGRVSTTRGIRAYCPESGCRKLGMLWRSGALVGGWGGQVPFPLTESSNSMLLRDATAFPTGVTWYRSS